jgi:MIP family channel proteins
MVDKEDAPSWQTKLGRKLRIRNVYVRILFAEFLGTFVLCCFGIGSIAQAVLSSREAPNGNILTISLGWGIGIAMGIYATGKVSGGHINPAVTGAMATLGRVPLLRVPFYFIGQYLGAFCGAAAIYIVYINALDEFDAGARHVPYHVNSTGDIWATYPLHHVETWQGFVDQLLSTGLFVIAILAVTDKHAGVTSGVAPALIGACFAGILSAFAYNNGGALNPARDLAPRVFTAIVGYNGAPFTFRNGNWFWVPIVGPHLGAIIGALLYNGLVGLHMP